MSRSRGHVPIRTCISCRSKRSKKELIRLIVDEQGLVVRDKSGTGKGRGAYICPGRICWDNAVKKHCFNRAFRCNIPVVFHPEFCV